MKPFPLQFEDKVSESTIADFRAATAKLKKYYARDGFESLRGSDLMILDLEKRYQADY
jgi:hypothetical protein